MNIFKSQRLFPYITGDSLVGKPITLTMAEVKVQPIPNPRTGQPEDKECLYFQETSKPLILIKTTAKMIASLYGGETSDWRGQPLELYAETVQAFGKTHNAVRVRAATTEPVLPKLEQVGE